MTSDDRGRGRGMPEGKRKGGGDVCLFDSQRGKGLGRRRSEMLREIGYTRLGQGKEGIC